MIYLDYSATTPLDPDALATYEQASRQLYGNPNSHHSAGMAAAKAIEEASAHILDLLGVPDRELIPTAGASEANNLAIKGIAFQKQHLGKHLLTTAFEHPSVTACFGFLQNQGFDVDFIDCGPDGRVDLESLEHLLREDTILVSVGKINSEIGIEQPTAEIGRLLKAYPYVTFHSDMTQAIGKIPVDLESIDLVSFSAHKFFGPKGIGGLIRRNSVILAAQIHGGRATTDYRSGTPATPLILAMETALRKAYERLDLQYRHVYGLKRYLIERLSPHSGIVMNDSSVCIPHIVNLSILSVEAETMMRRLDDSGICVSTQTACHTGSGRSESVFRFTHDELRAKTSLRISLSGLTTREEVDALADRLIAEVTR
jgi:cysteine desulfurase